MPDSTSVEDCQRIVEKHSLLPQFPSSVRELFACGALEETPKSDDPVFVRSRWWTILSNKSAVEAAASEAARLVLTSKSITPATIGTTTAPQVSGAACCSCVWTNHALA